jgi:hypothetical protein
MAETKDNTTTSQMDISIDELLGTPGAENIMVPESKPSLFSRNPKVDIDKMLLEKTDEEKAADEAAAKLAAEAAAAGGAPIKKTPEEEQEIQDLLDPQTDEEKAASEKEDATKKSGRAGGLAELGARLIEKGYLIPFEGEEDVSKYGIKDWEELFESNEKEKRKKTKEEVSGEFYEELPEELQVAAHYVANGGQDLKSLFRSLAAVEEIRQLDTTDEAS